MGIPISPVRAAPSNTPPFVLSVAREAGEVEALALPHPSTSALRAYAQGEREGVKEVLINSPPFVLSLSKPP